MGIALSPPALARRLARAFALAMCLGLGLGAPSAEGQVPGPERGAGGAGAGAQAAPAGADAERLVREGRSAYEAGRLVEARDALTRAHVLAPGSAEAAYLLGLTFLRGERYEQAAGWFEKALARDPKRHAAHYSLGVVRLQQGSAAAALVALDRAIALDPRFADSHHQRGLALEALGRPDAEVAAALAEAARLAPRHWKARYRLGLALRRQGDLAAAALALRDAESAGAPAQAVYALAQVERLLGDADGSRRTLARFAALREEEREAELRDRARTKAHDLLARARLDLAEGDAAAARPLLERAIELAPTTEAYESLAAACRALGDEDGASAADAAAARLSAR